jgi:hypothetical protein
LTQDVLDRNSSDNEDAPLVAVDFNSSPAILSTPAAALPTTDLEELNLQARYEAASNLFNTPTPPRKRTRQGSKQRKNKK